jgi:hypothetical protein
MLTLQSVYSDLLENVSYRDSLTHFPPGGAFFCKKYRGTNYWYYRLYQNGEAIKRYLGKETPEVLHLMQQHGKASRVNKNCRTLIKALQGGGCVFPLGPMGAVAKALADAGFFRLRGVLVGTLAFQCYPAMLGVDIARREGIAGIKFVTGDIDLAQFRSISLAVEDQMTESFAKAIGQAGQFEPVLPFSMADSRPTRWHDAATGCFVDLLVPLVGKDEEVMYLPSMQAYGAALRFLDFLIYDERPAVIPYRGGIAVNVPSPERYAVHKLIISQNRRDKIKQKKDIAQASFLLEAMLHSEKAVIRETVQEAADRGKGWRTRLGAGIRELPSPLAKEILGFLTPAVATAP